MSQTDENPASMSSSEPLPPIRRPVIFYASVAVAYGFLAAAILALVLV